VPINKIDIAEVPTIEIQLESWK